MSDGFLQRSRITPWAGLLVPPFAWAAHHQLGSDLIFFDCGLGRTGLIVGLGLVMGLITVAAGFVSWGSRHGGERASVRTFAAVLGVMSASIFLLALAYQTEAALVLPACHR